jgi:hypothetical protein
MNDQPKIKVALHFLKEAIEELQPSKKINVQQRFGGCYPSALGHTQGVVTYVSHQLESVVRLLEEVTK